MLSSGIEDPDQMGRTAKRMSDLNDRLDDIEVAKSSLL